MLITEACRGEGGRLYYLNGNKRIYFMEDFYGPKGNLMPRDIVSKHIYDAPSQVYLDISFLGKDLIDNKLSEVKELCKKYINLDVTKESIPVCPSVHFFMGGLAVNNKHQTNIKKLYAIGECASIYHGANRLGGNSLLAAIRGGYVASCSINEEDETMNVPDFSNYEKIQNKELIDTINSKCKSSTLYIRQEIAKIMDDSLGITRCETKLLKGINDINQYIKTCDSLVFDNDMSYYFSYSLKPLLVLAKAILLSALNRKESRGSHIRTDYPNQIDEYGNPTYINYMDGKYDVKIGKE
jgi:succinate dehydrogenase / fumarate reductase flavoprotein subunit